MVDGATTNYGFVKPDKTSPMNDFTDYLNNNWDKVTGITAPDSITGALPQTGSYNIGDRVYRTDDNSIYILIAKDANWGWFWRPVHAAISPWIPVPAAAIVLSPWSGTVNASNPFAIALDNRGNCHWRGVIGMTSGTLTANFSYIVLAQLPVGIRPRMAAMYQTGYASFGAATGETEGTRVYIAADGTSSIRAQGVFATTCQITKLYLDGKMRYAIGSGQYFGA